MNPAWDEELTAGRGGRALRRGGRARAVDPRARARRRRAPTGARWTLVRAAIERSADPRVVELDRKLPWHETVVTTAPEALFVVYPKSDGWGMQAVPKVLGEFDEPPGPARGVGGAAAAPSWPRSRASRTRCSCTSKRFYASAGSREGILAARRRVNAPLSGGAGPAPQLARPAPATRASRSSHRKHASSASRPPRRRRDERVDRRQVRRAPARPCPPARPRADSIPPAAFVRCSLIRRTSSIAPSARSTSARSAGASSPSTPPLAISTRARASEYATSSASRDPSSGS